MPSSVLRPALILTVVGVLQMERRNKVHDLRMTPFTLVNLRSIVTDSPEPSGSLIRVLPLTAAILCLVVRRKQNLP